MCIPSGGRGVAVARHKSNRLRGPMGVRRLCPLDRTRRGTERDAQEQAPELVGIKKKRRKRDRRPRHLISRRASLRMPTSSTRALFVFRVAVPSSVRWFKSGRGDSKEQDAGSNEPPSHLPLKRGNFSTMPVAGVRPDRRLRHFIELGNAERAPPASSCEAYPQRRALRRGFHTCPRAARMPADICRRTARARDGTVAPSGARPGRMCAPSGRRPAARMRSHLI